jgi:hypothetical protein
MKRLHIILAILCLCHPLLSAQDEGSQLLFEQFEQRFAALDTLIFASNGEPNTQTLYHDSTVFMQHWLIGKAYVAERDSLVDNKVAAEIKTLKHETGLALTGQTYYRLDDGLAIDEDDAVSRYQAKIQVELRWNFLGSSLIHRDSRVRELELQGDLARVDLDKVNIASLVADHQDYYRQKYDSLLSGILRHRLFNLTLMSQAQMYLLQHGNISSDEMLNIINDKAEAERTLMACAKLYPYAQDLAHPAGLVVKIDSATLLDYVRTHHPDLTKLQIQSEILMQQMQNRSFWREMNISPFVRYSYYFRSLLPNSTNVDLGINFSIPLTLQTNKKRAVVDAERLIVDMEREQLEQKIIENIHTILLDIERLNRTSVSELNRLQELKQYLQVRSNAYNNRKGGYNIILRTKEYNTYLLCWEKFLSYQYQRDCLLMSLQTYLPNVSVFEFCVGEMVGG